MHPSSHLTPLQLAKRWNITTKTLSQWRYIGRGPRYSKVSRHVTYLLADIEQYEMGKRYRSTSEYDRRPSGDVDQETNQELPQTPSICQKGKDKP